MLCKNKRIHVIIHLAAATAGGVGAGLAQLPGADMPALTSLQIAMIIAIGHEYGCTTTKAKATSILLTFPAAYGGRAAVQALLGMIPGYGNTIRAGTAMAITEAIGWAADAYFSGSAIQEQLS